MADKPSQNELVEQTVFAVRVPGARGWRIRAVQNRPDDLKTKPYSEHEDGSELRLIGTLKVAQEFADYRCERRAAYSGWTKDSPSGLWFPMEEALPYLSGNPQQTSLKLDLKSILFGYICVSVTCDETTVDFHLDDVEDSLELFAGFCQLLRENKEPHGYLGDECSTLFIVQKVANPQLRRLIIRKHEDRSEPAIDVLIEANLLTREFSGLASSIADSPFLGHHFVCHAYLPSASYERALDEAELTWKGMVEAGLVKDEFDLQEEFEGR
jgi:hypothetical protein